ncbi:MAG: formate dehydrogenase [Rhodospirillales bacterium 69-11]|jgi:formate dehydrogenase subunit delta|nr:formate dehydrogenase subunit delta [Rhodospirillales bacterium]MBN8926143.1 formate dehydrogenase subunit delta [Rhodospirillales bacterium]OJW19550.1 MAG: formate dehydrogenase [Rhodospirillales bacterium 69-11]
MSPEKLAYMANQIGRFFATQTRADVVDGIADHLVKFWDPRMRATLLAHLDDPAITLDPPVRAAAQRLRAAPPA